MRTYMCLCFWPFLMEQSLVFYSMMTKDKEKERTTGSGVEFCSAFFGPFSQGTETDCLWQKSKEHLLMIKRAGLRNVVSFYRLCLLPRTRRDRNWWRGAILINLSLKLRMHTIYELHCAGLLVSISPMKQRESSFTTARAKYSHGKYWGRHTWKKISSLAKERQERPCGVTWIGVLSSLGSHLLDERWTKAEGSEVKTVLE